MLHLVGLNIVDGTEWARYDAGFLASSDPRDVNVRDVEWLREMREKNQFGRPPLQDPWAVESTEAIDARLRGLQ